MENVNTQHVAGAHQLYSRKMKKKKEEKKNRILNTHMKRTDNWNESIWIKRNAFSLAMEHQSWVMAYEAENFMSESVVDVWESSEKANNNT